MKPFLSRRHFLQGAASAGMLGFTGCAGFPSITSSRSVNGKLRLASIGVGAQGRGNVMAFAKHKRTEMAAFCDVDSLMLDRLRPQFPKARFYRNWREMLDAEDLDAVMVATPDHSHCEIMSEVMRRGLNLYAEKPLCRTLEECETLRTLSESSGVVTQMGTQIAAWECDRHTAELIRMGAIGEIKKIWLFSGIDLYKNMMPRRWPLTPEKVPETLDWKGWLASAPYRPYVSKYYHTFKWRIWRDFGTGWLGDMGSHLFSPLWLGMDLGPARPLWAKAAVHDLGWSEEFKKQFLPIYTHVTWRFPGVKASGGNPFEVEWCDGPVGGGVPEEFLPPKRFKELAAKTPIGKLPPQGRVVEGSEGWMISTHFNLPPVLLKKDGTPLPLKLPFLSPAVDHNHEFSECCLDGGVPRSSFKWTTYLTDWILLGRQAIDNPGTEIKMA